MLCIYLPIFYSYTCTADNGVGNPVTEEVLLTVLCKYIDKLQRRFIGPNGYDSKARMNYYVYL